MMEQDIPESTVFQVYLDTFGRAGFGFFIRQYSNRHYQNQALRGVPERFQSLRGMLRLYSKFENTNNLYIFELS